MARLRTGQPLGPLDLVEDAQDARLSPPEQAIVDAGLRRAVVGTPSEAAEQVRALAERFGVVTESILASSSAPSAVFMSRISMTFPEVRRGL